MTSERKNIKIKTLPPVHIGSGEVLQENFDYIRQEIDGDNFLSVINHKKVAENLLAKKISIDKWTACLQRGDNVKYFLEQFFSEGDDSFLDRYIYLEEIPSKIPKQLREHIHDGLGRPYIPGSSIKGAIRTVILSSMLRKGQKNNNKPDDLLKTKKKDKYGNLLDYNLMQTLQISDACFEQESMDAINMINLNIRENNSYQDEKASQFVEAITTEEESSLSMKIADTTMCPVKSIKELFALINNHTKRIIQNDIDFWYDYIADDDIVGKYIDVVNEIKEKVNKVEDNSCILRVGHANGWKFMTGDWAMGMMTVTEWNDIVRKARPGNDKKYTDYPFPKSRRINKQGKEVQLLGFVKLTIEE